MPKGVYPRTAAHIAICSKAGQASARSPVNIERYSAHSHTLKCERCGASFTRLKSISRRFCSYECSKTHTNKLSYGAIHYRIRTMFGTLEVRV